MSSSDQEGSSQDEQIFVKQVIKALSGSRWTPRKLLEDGIVVEDGDGNVQHSVCDSTEPYPEGTFLAQQDRVLTTERQDDNAILGIRLEIPQNLLLDPRFGDVCFAFSLCRFHFSWDGGASISARRTGTGGA
jgi:hypothetical protein